MINKSRIDNEFIKTEGKLRSRYQQRKSEYMTICIVAMGKCSGKQSFVFSTDHMVDAGIGQFEHNIKKYKFINDKTVAMLAGRALLFNELISNIDKNLKFSDIKNKIYENFIKIKKESIKRELLDIYGLEEADLKELVKTEIKNDFVAVLLKEIVKHTLSTGILLFGFEEGEPKIFEIDESGINDFSDIQFHAIGSGDVQAINTLLFQRQSKHNDLKTTLYNVFKAKKNAEVRSGVGKETDILILTEDKHEEINKNDLQKLQDIYKAELEFGTNHKNLEGLDINKGWEKNVV